MSGTSALEFLVRNMLANKLIQTEDPLTQADRTAEVLIEQARIRHWGEPAATSEFAASMLVDLEEILADVKNRVLAMATAR